jgi:membrane-bound lytic murein transglycosylase D
MKILSALLLAVPFFAAAQTPEVPHKMSFADMTLTIRDDARREIQKDVDAMTRSPKHFNIKADRARTYFPIIEKVFEKEGVPDDFKYLVLQESSLVADAVSTSNAVGFWQFKDFTAIEMGLRVDNEIDERMNIAASSRAAARYIQKNNSLFDNWLYALQAYQMGAGGVMRSVSEDNSGKKHAEITSKTYWYIKKFLAHKIAFENAVKGKGQVELMVIDSEKSRKDLMELSKDISIDVSELMNYNKWTKSGKIPSDRNYAVIVPMVTGVKLPVETIAVAKADETSASRASEKTEYAASSGKIRINNIPAVAALPQETTVQFAERNGVDLAQFLKWNDLGYSTKLVPGSYYFVAKKRARASEDFHTLIEGETLWQVSQRYGLQLKKLKKFNRVQSEVPAGTTLWLSSVKPRSAKNAVTAPDVVQVDDSETFSWASSPSDQSGSTPSQDPIEPAETPANDSVEVIYTNEGGQSASITIIPVVNDSTQVNTFAGDSSNVTSVVVSESAVIKQSGSRHAVQAKETLYAIAKTYNVAVMDLVRWNNLDLQQGIKIGQILIVSDPEGQKAVLASNKEVVHEVKASDTLYGIARKYGVTIKQIMDWNEKKDFTLSVGEKLKVAAPQ